MHADALYQAYAVDSILITVAELQGSAPREVGAQMRLAADGKQWQSIGGGHLEWAAQHQAQTMLALAPDSLAAQRHLQRWVLGASLGQCCGGVVWLSFERIAANQSIPKFTQGWRCLPLHQATPAVFTSAQNPATAGELPAAFPAALQLALAKLNPHTQLWHSEQQSWLLQAAPARLPHLVLVGAGHVGQALVKALSDLACRISWLDQRENLLDAVLAPQVQTYFDDDVMGNLAELASQTDPAYYLIASHSHQLDYQICYYLLQQQHFAWLGLIGSHSKRQQFMQRFSRQGLSAQQTADLCCPIGIAGISGKHPAIIAASVTAQLLQLWQSAELSQP